MNSQLKKGILELLILNMLRNEKNHGYQLVVSIQKLIPNTEPSTIYGIIRRLTSKNLITSYVEANKKGPSRKILELTSSGLIYLEKASEELSYLYNLLIN